MVSIFLLVAGLLQPIEAAGQPPTRSARAADSGVSERDTSQLGVGVRFRFARTNASVASPFEPAVAVAPTSRIRTERLRLAVSTDSTCEQLVEYSDGFYTRLTIHRFASYGILPLFALQYIAGQQRLTKGRFAPAWARDAHLPLAIAVGGLFSLNTVTGLWNLAESSQDPYGRARRTVHAVTMLVADLGFALTGILAPDITTIEQRLARGDTSWTPHKTVAVSSMGLSLVSYLMMLVWN